MKKRHHYITRYFLDGFCDKKGFVWTYEKENPEKSWSSKPGETAFVNYLYTLEFSENKDEFEDYLSEKIEGPAADYFKTLNRKIFPDQTGREKLSIFFLVS